MKFLETHEICGKIKRYQTTHNRKKKELFFKEL